MPPEELWRVFDLFAMFVFPLELIEFIISIEDDELLSDYLRDFFKASFAHPVVNPTTLW